MLSFTKKEKGLFKKLNTPAKVQDYLNSVPFNFEEGGVDTAKSPLRVIREKNAHCLEGAILGAYILSLHGYKPLVLHLKTTEEDFEHCIAPFEERGLWGALSKTNHNVLRYREPVYKSIRELVMSYFHEYFTDSGVKTLRSFSSPLNLHTFKKGWEESGKDLWDIDRALDKIKHYNVVPKQVLRKLRKADIIEREAGKIVEYKKKK